MTRGEPPYPGAPQDPPAPTWIDDPNADWYVDPTWGQGPPTQSPPPARSDPETPPDGFTYGGPPPGPPRQGGYGWAPPPAPPPERDNGRRPGSNNTLLLAVIALVVVAGLIGGGIFLMRGGTSEAAGDQQSVPQSPVASGESTSNSPSSSSTPSPNSSAQTPKAQARAVDSLLDKAMRQKNKLTGTYGKALECRISPAKAEKRFTATAKSRRSIVAKARKLDTSKLPHGGAIKQRLITMYTTSAKADDAFAAWARAGDKAGVDCLEENAKRRKGNRLSVKSGKQKKKFTKVWNPVATQYGFEKRSRDDL